MKVIKRNGSIQDFDTTKIKNAIIGANNEMDEYHKIWEDDIDGMVDEVVYELTYGQPINEDFEINIEEIQDAVEFCLMRAGYYKLAKAYIEYRYQRKLVRELHRTDESILTLIEGTNDELRTENSNKNTKLAPTQRDYMAGEVAKDVAKRLLLPKEIVDAHENGVLHFHDMDYSPMQPIFNCCLINIGDMLDNGTCVNGTKIDSPSSFPTACTIMTQIIASVASGQYGGQSVNIKHLGKYLKRSYDKYHNMFGDMNLAHSLMFKDLHDGVQTIQYQINTISCTNG